MLFVRLNVHLDEMRSEYWTVPCARPFRIMCWSAGPELPAELTAISSSATDVGYDDSNRLNKMLYLIPRRKSE